jgi:hypothetical protein
MREAGETIDLNTPSGKKTQKKYLFPLCCTEITYIGITATLEILRSQTGQNPQN